MVALRFFPPMSLSPKATRVIATRSTLALAALLQGTATAAPPQTVASHPRPEVGVISHVSDPKSHHCTASIVDSPQGNIIVTAAHCVTGKSSVFFTPGFDNGRAPYGTWKAATIHIEPGWSTNSNNTFPETPYDYAFVVLHPHDDKNVAKVTGASLVLKSDAALPARMQLFGYPNNRVKSYLENKSYRDNTPYRCDSTASRDAEYWEILQCLGVPNGFSGSPWITGTRDVIGVASSSTTTTPATTASVAAPVPPESSNQGYALGNGPLWQHASLITCGAFTGGAQLDMLVLWSDGEVTMYQGSRSTTEPQRPFVGEFQLAAPGGIWTHAAGFASLGHGVVVTWNDGEVSYYRTVSAGGFGGEVQLAAPNALWRDHAAHIAGLGGDLVVVWSDGEVTLYRDVVARGLGAEQQLVPPNETWTHARSVSDGSWVGGSGTADLLVRWSDGEVTIYGDVATAGLGQEHQVKPLNELWTHATVVSGRGNAVVVRWSDGEVSLYPDVDGALHREIQLVAP